MDKQISRRRSEQRDAGAGDDNDLASALSSRLRNTIVFASQFARWPTDGRADINPIGSRAFAT